jgi:hypothetical protein
MWFSSFFASSLDSRTLAVTSATRAWNLRDCKPHDHIPCSKSLKATFSSRCGCATGESMGTEGFDIHMLLSRNVRTWVQRKLPRAWPKLKRVANGQRCKGWAQTRHEDRFTLCRVELRQCCTQLLLIEQSLHGSAQVNMEHNRKPALQGPVSSPPPTRHWTVRSRRSRLADPPNQRYQAQYSQSREWQWRLRSKMQMLVTLLRLQLFKTASNMKGKRTSIVRVDNRTVQAEEMVESKENAAAVLEQDRLAELAAIHIHLLCLGLQHELCERLVICMYVCTTLCIRQYMAHSPCRAQEERLRDAPQCQCPRARYPADPRGRAVPRA